MTNNRIILIDEKRLEKLKKELRIGTNIVEIDGKNIQTWEEYINEIRVAFKFPDSPIYYVEMNKAGYLDWMRDLQWFFQDNPQKDVCLIIMNYESFLLRDRNLKNSIVEMFVSSILPWWEEEVVYCGGGLDIRRNFSVYLTEKNYGDNWNR